MLHEIIHLNKHYNLENDPKLEILVPYLNDFNLRDKSRGILICPGGGYSFVSVREADAVALAYMNNGYCTFILHYTINKPYPTPMHELACAMDYLRHNAEKYYLDKDKIAIIGFSAGGHLVSSYGYLHKNSDFLNTTNLSKENIKPNCLVLSYPVITMDIATHGGTRNVITGGKKELLNLMSVEKNIDKEYPPTFIWTTKEDTIVPYVNSTLLVDELVKHNVKHKFVLFDHLDHGKSTGSKLINEIDSKEEDLYKELSTWVDKSLDFLDEVLK